MDYFETLGLRVHYREALQSYTREETTDVLNGIEVDVVVEKVDLGPYDSIDTIADLLGLEAQVSANWKKARTTSGPLTSTRLMPKRVLAETSVDEMDNRSVDCRMGRPAFMPSTPSQQTPVVTEPAPEETPREKFISRAGTSPTRPSCPPLPKKGLTNGTKKGSKNTKRLRKAAKKSKVPTHQLTRLSLSDLEIIDFSVSLGTPPTQEEKHPRE